MPFGRSSWYQFVPIACRKIIENFLKIIRVKNNFMVFWCHTQFRQHWHPKHISIWYPLLGSDLTTSHSWTSFYNHSISAPLFLKKAVHGLFSLYKSFLQTVSCKYCSIKVADDCNSNPGPLLSEVSALPIVPQPLLIVLSCLVTYLVGHFDVIFYNFRQCD